MCNDYNNNKAHTDIINSKLTMSMCVALSRLNVCTYFKEFGME